MLEDSDLDSDTNTNIISEPRRKRQRRGRSSLSGLDLTRFKTIEISNDFLTLYTDGAPIPLSHRFADQFKEEFDRVANLFSSCLDCFHCHYSGEQIRVFYKDYVLHCDKDLSHIIDGHQLRWLSSMHRGTRYELDHALTRVNLKNGYVMVDYTSILNSLGRIDFYDPDPPDPAECVTLEVPTHSCEIRLCDDGIGGIRTAVVQRLSTEWVNCDGTISDDFGFIQVSKNGITTNMTLTPDQASTLRASMIMRPSFATMCERCLHGATDCMRLNQGDRRHLHMHCDLSGVISYHEINEFAGWSHGRRSGNISYTIDTAHTNFIRHDRTADFLRKTVPMTNNLWSTMFAQSRPQHFDPFNSHGGRLVRVEDPMREKYYMYNAYTFEGPLSVHRSFCPQRCKVKQNPNDVPCSICLEPYKVNESIWYFPCAQVESDGLRVRCAGETETTDANKGHYLHNDCLYRMFHRGDRRCPSCRKPVGQHCSYWFDRRNRNTAARLGSDL